MANGTFLLLKSGPEHRAGRTWNMEQPNPKVSFVNFSKMLILTPNFKMWLLYQNEGLKHAKGSFLLWKSGPEHCAGRTWIMALPKG